MLHETLFAISVAAGAGLAVVALPGMGTSASAAQAGGAPACPEKLVGQASLVCACSAEATAVGSVWGDELYTDDSAICRAAVHAGAIPESGGTIWAFERPGQPTYAASQRNGISSSAWGSWARSIAVRPASEAPADAKPWAAACPANAVGLQPGAALTCSCSIEAIAAGSVWGSGPYTADSSICRAARHAGAVSAAGGEVRLRVGEGRESYVGSERNGVTAGQWGSFSTSFAF
jgi:hypothetical protein